MDGLILLIKPGRVGVIDSRSARAALQFYGRRIGLDQRWEIFTYNSIPILIPTGGVVHGWDVNLSMMNNPKLQVNQISWKKYLLLTPSYVRNHSRTKL